MMRCCPTSRLLLTSAKLSLLGFMLIARAARPQTSSPSLLDQADEALREMSRTTGLPVKAPLNTQIISRPEIKKYLEENLHREYTPQELHVQEAVLKAFGLVSRDFNLEKFLIGFYTEQAAGFYDPRRKTMFIADWPDEQTQRLVLAHELTHALQDQNFDLERFLHATRADDDATNARQAVVEGYATAAMMQHLVEPVELANLPSLEPLMAGIIHQQFEEFPAFSKAPFFFRFQALFPYAQGMGFIQRGLAQGGWARLNQLFSRPPGSTKEIFEPRIYFDRNPLPKIELPRPSALAGVPGLRLLTENVVGQLGYYALLGQIISETEANAVALGWLADRYVLYEYDGVTPARYALVSRTRWSSSETALALFRDYHTVLAKKYPELAPDPRSDADSFLGRTSSGAVILLRKGNEVVWAEGVPLAQTDSILSWLRSLAKPGQDVSRAGPRPYDLLARPGGL